MSTAAQQTGITAAVLAIGDEVLRGEIVNGNAAFLSSRLFDLGLVLREHAVVSDDPGDIRGALRRLGSVVDVIVATGGLGPTEDDRTVDVVCDLLGVGSSIDEPSRAVMEARFAKSGYALTPNNLRQVRVPVGAAALANAVGLAPGFGVGVARAQAFFMPGVPREMMRIFEDHVVPRLADRLEREGVKPGVARTWHIYGIGESHADHRLAGLLDGVADATLHYRVAMPELHVKVVLRGRDRAAARAELERLDGDVRRRLGDVVYGVDDDTFAWAVQRAFRDQGATLALAESCTGGYAGQLVTAEPGASDFFRGGVVSYANDVKSGLLGVRPETLREHGAVSEPCAAEMADGARKATGATVAVAITGVAGSDRDVPLTTNPATPPTPDAATAGAKPVGMVCFGVAGPGGTRAETKLFSGGRERIRRSAAFYALALARRCILDGSGND